MTKPNIYYARKIKKAKAIPDPFESDLTVIDLYMKRLSSEILALTKIQTAQLNRSTADFKALLEGVRNVTAIRE